MRRGTAGPTHRGLATNKGKYDRDGQLVLALPHDEVQDNAQLWQYTVLATNAPRDIAAIGQLYRDRCDRENGFDELKNPWRWGGSRRLGNGCF